MISLVIVLLYFAISAALVGGYWVYDLGVDEITARLTGAWLSLLGKKERKPFMPPTHDLTTVPADDPTESWMLQASPAERRYLALSMLREDIEENRLTPHTDHRELLQHVTREMHVARDEAEQNIASRLEVFRENDDGLQERWTIKDPVLHYQRRAVFTTDDMLRMDTEHAMERQCKITAKNVLEEVTHAA